MNLHDANDPQFTTPENPCGHCDPDDPVDDCWHCQECGSTEWTNTQIVEAHRTVIIDPTRNERDWGELEEDSMDSEEGWECNTCGNTPSDGLYERLGDWL